MSRLSSYSSDKPTPREVAQTLPSMERIREMTFEKIVKMGRSFFAFSFEKRAPQLSVNSLREEKMKALGVKVLKFLQANQDNRFQDIFVGNEEAGCEDSSFQASFSSDLDFGEKISDLSKWLRNDRFLDRIFVYFRLKISFLLQSKFFQFLVPFLFSFWLLPGKIDGL